jgi:mitochondrial chaperone BCS1
VVLPNNQRDALVADATRFASAGGWYQERGVPYRRGYLFSGPPGCGKTSLAFALASHLRRPIYVINLGSMATDENLLKAFSKVPGEAVLLIEDVDSFRRPSTSVHGRL